MDTLTRVNTPLIDDRSLNRLRAFARPSRLNSESTMFEAGIERAKQDLVELLQQEFGSAPTNAREPVNAEKPRWWRR